MVLKLFTMATSTILFGMLLSQYIRIDSSHQNKIEIFETESEAIFKKIGVTTIQIYTNELETISNLINNIINFYQLLNYPQTPGLFRLSDHFVDLANCHGHIDFIRRLQPDASIFDYDYIQLNTANRVCLPCQVLSVEDADNQCEAFKKVEFADADTDSFYQSKFSTYSTYFFNMLYLNQFYDLWNSATGIKRKFDFYKLFRLMWFIHRSLGRYLQEKSSREYMLYLIGVMKKAQSTSQSQFLVTSFPSTSFAELTTLHKQFFDLRNDIQLRSLEQGSDKHVDLILNLDLDDSTRLFLMLDCYNIAKNLLNQFEGLDIRVDAEAGETAPSGHQVLFEDLDASQESFVTEKENDNDYTILRIKKRVRVFKRVLLIEYSRRFQSRLKSKRFYLMNYITAQLILPTILFIYIFLQLHIIKSLFIERVGA